MSLLNRTASWHNAPRCDSRDAERRTTLLTIATFVALVFSKAALAGDLPTAAAPSNPLAGHWAFRAPVDQRPPDVRRGDLVGTPIDRFIFAQLEAAGLEPAPAADKRTLIRRATYDLIGLPPTATEIEAFVADDSPAAFERVVERLLASPHYGERWGRYWLDAARYADTKGYIYDGREDRRFFHSHVYRDWVIQALNDDLPYDQFLIQQIAGDRVATPEDRTPLAAMGFVTVGRRFAGNFYEIIDDRIDTLCRTTMALTVSCARCHDHKFDPIPTADYYSLYSVFAGSYDAVAPLAAAPDQPGGSPEFVEELTKRQAAFDELLAKKSEEVVGRVRARTADYLIAVLDVESLPTEHEYTFLAEEDLNPVFVRQWQAFLIAGVPPSGGVSRELDPIFEPWHAVVADASFNPEPSATAMPEWLSTNAARLNPRIAEALISSPPQSKRDLAERLGKVFERVNQDWLAAVEAAKAAGTEQPTALADPHDEAIRQVLYGPGSPIRVPRGHSDELEWFFDEATRVELGKLQTQIEQWLVDSPDSPPHVVYLADQPAQPEPRIFENGNPAIKGEAIPRAFLERLSGVSPGPFDEGSGRYELALAIASPENPLTARVFVNRVWLHHFGSGFVSTPSDFGVRSDPPSHPELLDWLARRFVADGWSLKKLHRMIVHSHTYRQTSSASESALAIDPDNRLLSRMNRRRLDYESLRDSLLAVTGALDPAIGGRPQVDPDDNSVGNDLRVVPNGLGAVPRRRSLYSFVDRLNVPSVMRVFDVASPDVHSPERHETTVPQQALYLLNSPFLLDRVRAVAARPEVVAAATAEERVDAMHRAIFARPATPREREIGARLAQSEIAEPIQQPAPTWLYGSGTYDAALGQVQSFQPLADFADSAWQGGASAGGRLTATGGHAGGDPLRALIRRWIAPADATVSVGGEIGHESEEGDGVKAVIVSSRAGELATFNVRKSSAETTLSRIEIKQGDTLDFVVLCRVDSTHDDFTWSPVIQYAAEGVEPGEWNAAKEFAGPPPAPLTPWEKYAQVLLLTNEFAFVD